MINTLKEIKDENGNLVEYLADGVNKLSLNHPFVLEYIADGGVVEPQFSKAGIFYCFK